jgi:hypothetical protein
MKIKIPFTHKMLNVEIEDSCFPNRNLAKKIESIRLANYMRDSIKIARIKAIRSMSMKELRDSNESHWMFPIDDSSPIYGLGEAKRLTEELFLDYGHGEIKE